MKREGEKYTICVDFDGVIHSYTSPWVSPEVIPDPPVPGAIDWLNEIQSKFAVVIHTTRAVTPLGQAAVVEWLDANGCLGAIEMMVTNTKEPALVYIDDRGYRFTGANFPTAREIHEARPWNKQKEE